MKSFSKMKRIILLLAVVTILLSGCKKENGSIYGTITDKIDGEPMRAAGVELFQGENLLTKTVTGNEGNYEFMDLSSREYILKVTVYGYRDIEYKVLVNSGKTVRADMQLENRDIFTDDYVVLKSYGIMVQLQDFGTADWNAASAMCKSSMLCGFNDWRLPTIGELAVLCQNSGIIGGFSSGVYWSSTLCDYYYHDYNTFLFSNKSTDCRDKSYSYYVRAVRSLP